MESRAATMASQLAALLSKDEVGSCPDCCRVVDEGRSVAPVEAGSDETKGVGAEAIAATEVSRVVTGPVAGGGPAGVPNTSARASGNSGPSACR